jgi:hypothetical protein
MAEHWAPTQGIKSVRAKSLVDTELGHALILDKVHVVYALRSRRRMARCLLSPASFASFERVPNDDATKARICA